MSAHIGVKLKQLREAQGASLNELSARTSLTEENISQIEEGRIDPSAATLIKLSRALGMRLGTLLDGEECEGPVVMRKETEAGALKVKNEGEADTYNLNFRSLAKGKPDRHMEPFVIDVTPLAPEDTALSHHEGEELVYVLEGRVRLRYGSEEYELGPGDSIYYDSVIPHRLSSLSDGNARVLAVIYAPF